MVHNDIINPEYPIPSQTFPFHDCVTWISADMSLHFLLVDLINI